MIVAACLYALVAAAVFGWLIRQHLYARNSLEDVPLHIFVLMPLLWGPVLLAVVLLIVVAIVAHHWREWRR